MKNIFLIIAFSLWMAGSALAHPPTAIEIKYDPKTQAITAIIAHQSSNVKRHYVDKVIISVNGVAAGPKYFHWQQTPPAQTVVFTVPGMKAGDVIGIEAHCNIGGHLYQQIKVEP